MRAGELGLRVTFRGSEAALHVPRIGKVFALRRTIGDSGKTQHYAKGVVASTVREADCPHKPLPSTATTLA